MRRPPGPRNSNRTRFPAGRRSLAHDLGDLRAEIPAFEDATYLNFGASDPSPRRVVEASSRGSASSAVGTFESLGVADVQARIRRLAGRLADSIPEERLLSPADPESGLVTVDVDDPERTVERLHEAGVVVRDLPDSAAVRASVHGVTTAADVDRLLDALAEEW